ncbi:MAG: PHP domain-containing protein [Nitrospinae bacterium]|nr:PHP domain-containing protein [Nitrospinota bacterium]
MAQGFADLHIHTNYSDGFWSPAQVVERVAAEGDLAVIAITDHDITDGVAETQAAAAAYGIEVIPAIEVSASEGRRPIHILGYFVDIDNAAFLAEQERVVDMRVERMRKMVAKLADFGIVVDMDELLAYAHRGIVGRLHLARFIVERGAVASLEEAFRLYLSDSGPCYVPIGSHTPKGAIEMVLQAGGVPVLAHPGTSQVDELIPGLVSSGLRGIEVWHGAHSPEQSRYYASLAKKHGLLASGGSDCHGPGKAEVLIGKVKLSLDIVEALRKAAGAKAAS